MSNNDPGLPSEWARVSKPTGREPGLPRLHQQRYKEMRITELVDLMTDRQALLFACDCVEHIALPDMFMFRDHIQHLLTLTRSYAWDQISTQVYWDSIAVWRGPLIRYNSDFAYRAEFMPDDMRHRTTATVYLFDAILRTTKIENGKIWNLNKRFVVDACNMAYFASIQFTIAEEGVKYPAPDGKAELDWQSSRAIEYLTQGSNRLEPFSKEEQCQD